jgi:hypothetical protein
MRPVSPPPSTSSASAASAAIGAAAGAALLALGGAGCAPPECVEDFDCRIGFVCAEGACVAAGGSNNNGNNNGGGGGDGDEGIEPELLLVGQPVSVIQPGFTPDEVLLGFYTADSEDTLRTFDVVEGRVGDIVVDFPLTAIGTCNIDTVTVEEGISLADAGGDEQWFTCVGGLYQAQDANDLQNFVVDSGAEGADLMLRLQQPDVTTNQVAGRRVYARRGTDSLVVEQVLVHGTAAPGTRRPRDVIDGVSFGEIAGLFLVSETDDNLFGDLILVFDRAYPGTDDKPALVPLERQNVFNEPTTWQLARPPWRVLALPEATHAVRVHTDDIGDVDQLLLGPDDEERVNLEVYLPTLGRVGVGRLELAMIAPGPFDPDTSGFAPLEFEPGDRPTATPSSRDRIILLPVPGDDRSVFYVMTNGADAWRLTLPVSTADAGELNNEVLRAQFNDEGSDRPASAVTIPGVDDQLWVAFTSPVDQLHRVTFSFQAN